MEPFDFKMKLELTEKHILHSIAAQRRRSKYQEDIQQILYHSISSHTISTTYMHTAENSCLDYISLVGYDQHDTHYVYFASRT